MTNENVNNKELHIMKYLQILVQERTITAQLQVNEAIKYMLVEYGSDIWRFEGDRLLIRDFQDSRGFVGLCAALT